MPTVAHRISAAFSKVRLYTNLYKLSPCKDHMKSRCLLNLQVTPEKKAQYREAAKTIGVSVSEICRRALDNAILLAETLKTPKPPEVVQ